jgi:hypothetical protein
MDCADNNVDVRRATSVVAWEVSVEVDSNLARLAASLEDSRLFLNCTHPLPWHARHPPVRCLVAYTWRYQ